MNILFGNSSPWGEAPTQEQTYEWGQNQFSEDNKGKGNGKRDDDDDYDCDEANVPVDNGIIFVVIFAVIFAMKHLAIKKIKPVEE